MAGKPPASRYRRGRGAQAAGRARPGDPGKLHPLSAAAPARADRPPRADHRSRRAGPRQAAVRRGHTPGRVENGGAPRFAGRLGVGELRARRAGQDHVFRHARTERPRDGAADETGGGNLVMLALYGHKFSSYTWKALIPLYANETDFEFCEVGPDFPENAEFVASAHPAGKFPVLTDRDATIIEATAIVE